MSFHLTSADAFAALFIFLNALAVVKMDFIL